MNISIIPSLFSLDAKKQFLHNSEGWLNFARRITCLWCIKQLGDGLSIHHHTYSHACTYNATKELIVGKPIRTVPDCETCKLNNEERFLNCMKKLSLVHPMCNKHIEEVRQSNALNSSSQVDIDLSFPLD